MAGFQSTITEQGMETLTRFLALGEELRLTRAEAGSGAAHSNWNTRTELVRPADVNIQMGEKEFVQSVPSYLLIPVHISNAGLTEQVFIREVGIFGLDERGKEFLFAYSWLDGGDTDNFLPPAKDPEGEADTVHVHEMILLATDQINAAVRIEVSGGSFVTASQMQAYAVKKPRVNGKQGQYLRLADDGTEWADIGQAPDFDNLLAWPGCTRVTPPKEGETWTESIITTAGNILRAQRVTVKNGDGDYTETYTFYAEDGAAVKEKYVVHTSRDGTAETWRETVTKEEDVNG